MEIILNQQYNNFTPIKQLNSKGTNGAPYFLCRCVCGVEKEVRKDNLGKVMGCGCTRKTYRQNLNKITIASVANKKARTAKTEPAKQPKYIPSTTLNIESKLEQMRLEKEYSL